jgi:hypothetical protein
VKIHNPVGAFLDTQHTLGAFLLVNSIETVFKTDGFYRTNLRALAALIANVDVIFSRARKQALNPQGGFKRVYFPEVFQCADNKTCPAS